MRHLSDPATRSAPRPRRALPSAMAEELAKVSQAMSSPDEFLALDMIYALPTKFREGTIVLANAGVCGVATGVYCYHSAAWKLLG